MKAVVTVVKNKSKIFCAAILSIAIILTTLAFPLSAFAESTEDENSYREYFASENNDRNAENSVSVTVNKELDKIPVNFAVNIPSDGQYLIGMEYMALGNETGALTVGVAIDGKAPFAEAEKLSFPRMWQDEGKNRTDGLGNEFAAKQVPYTETYYNTAIDITGWTAEPYKAFLSAGIHNVTVTPVSGSVRLKTFCFSAPEKTENYKAPSDSTKNYKGKPILLEGESAKLKSSCWLAAKADNSSVLVTPNSTDKNIVNYIGGGNWKTSGETIIWETPELEAGYYRLGYSYRQSTVLGGKTYRKFTVDGKIPFTQAGEVGFSYSHKWQQDFFSDDGGKPYLIYLSAGKHELGLSVVPGEIEAVCKLLNNAVSKLNSLYIDITMVTGETVDAYRDYDLFSQIPDMEQRLKDIDASLKKTSETLDEISGQSSGSHSSVIGGMIQVIEQMLENRYTAHRYKGMYYDKYCALAADLNDMRAMPLDLDKLVLAAANQSLPFEKNGILKQTGFSVQRFFTSFVKDYNSISAQTDDTKQVKIWVNWGRDQAQVLSSMAETSFTPETGVKANVQLVNASIVQAILSGNSPDCILQRSRSEPVDLAMRGVLYDLGQFDDLDTVLSRFQKDAEIPYRYKNRLYALPDTQQFYLLFYRKDILKQLEISVPDTWDDFKEVCKLLARNNFNVWMPNNVATNAAQTSAGVGSVNLFPTFLLQNGLSLYTDDGKSTTLSSSESIVIFNEWTNYYSKLKLPKAMDFYNRFRTGTCPLGIAVNTMYTTIKAAAPEIDGLWGVAHIPGTVRTDGSVSYDSAGAGTACAILKTTKNPQAAWEFLKWWTSSDTQLSFSNEVESLLGPTGRVAVSNIEAYKSMTWDADMITPMMKAWSDVKELPEYPGSYYVTRSIYQSFWNVVNNNRNSKDMLLKYSNEADKEIARKWQQYESR